MACIRGSRSEGTACDLAPCVPCSPSTPTERMRCEAADHRWRTDFVHIYGKEDAQQAKCSLTCALYFSRCALSRINVCGYLLSVTTRCPQRLFPSNCRGVELF